MEKHKSEFKKLFRKVRRAKRLNEPYEQWMPRIKELDDVLGSSNIGWVKGTCRR